MKDTYIFGGGDSDGLLGIATILHTVKDAFFSFTSPRTLHTEINQFVRGRQGRLYIVDLAIDHSTYLQLFREIRSRPGFKIYFFDQHNLPEGISAKDLRFTLTSIDNAISSCENAYSRLECGLDIMIPAMASLNDGLNDTPLIREASQKHGERLYRNARILKFGLAFNIKDNKFKRELVYHIKNGFYPDSIEELVSRYRQGVLTFQEIRRTADHRKIVKSNLTYGYFPNFRGGYANMVAGYLATNTQKPVGICILETERNTQKINLVSNDVNINLGEVVHEVATALGGVGGGSYSSAGATVNVRLTERFLERLDDRISQLKRK